MVDCCEDTKPCLPARLRGNRITMRPLLWVCLAALSVTLTSPAWSQQKPARIALVIGNAAYPGARTPLTTTIADARSLADELRRSGFEVDLKTNVGKADMRNAIDGFTNRIGAGVDALFYFSGYGMQADRQSYLMPVNADAWSPSDIRKDGIRIDSVLAEMHRKGARVKILIIDAARRNHWEGRFRPAPEGLAGIDAPENTLAMYSSVPGKLITDRAGTNSVFVGELIKEIRAANMAGAANVTAEDVFNHLKMGVYQASSNEQTPWVASSLVATVLLRPAADERQHGASQHATARAGKAAADGGQRSAAASERNCAHAQ